MFRFLRRLGVPAISVVMPVYNQAAYCRAAIQSIRKQTVRDLELIIVDDGSTDGSAEIIDSLARPRPAHPGSPPARTRGVSAAANAGLALARGELAARADSDDLCVADRLAVQMAYLAKHPRVVALGGAMMGIAADGRLLNRIDYSTDPAAVASILLRGCAIGNPTATMRRSAVMRIGGYREQFDYAEDYDLWLRLSEHGELANLPKILAFYRWHGGNVSARHSRRQAFCSEMARLVTLRRRAGGGDPLDRVQQLDQAAIDLLDLVPEERARLTGLLELAVDRRSPASRHGRLGSRRRVGTSTTQCASTA